MLFNIPLSGVAALQMNSPWSSMVQVQAQGPGCSRNDDRDRPCKQKAPGGSPKSTMKMVSSEKGRSDGPLIPIGGFDPSFKDTDAQQESKPQASMSPPGVLDSSAAVQTIGAFLGHSQTKYAGSDLKFNMVLLNKPLLAQAKLHQNDPVVLKNEVVREINQTVGLTIDPKEITLSLKLDEKSERDRSALVSKESDLTKEIIDQIPELRKQFKNNVIALPVMIEMYKKAVKEYEREEEEYYNARVEANEALIALDETSPERITYLRRPKMSGQKIVQLVNMIEQKIRTEDDIGKWVQAQIDALRSWSQTAPEDVRLPHDLGQLVNNGSVQAFNNGTAQLVDRMRQFLEERKVHWRNEFEEINPLEVDRDIMSLTLRPTRENWMLSCFIVFEFEGKFGTYVDHFQRLRMGVLQERCNEVIQPQLNTSYQTCDKTFGQINEDMNLLPILRGSADLFWSMVLETDIIGRGYHKIVKQQYVEFVKSLQVRSLQVVHE